VTSQPPALTALTTPSTEPKVPTVPVVLVEASVPVTDITKGALNNLTQTVKQEEQLSKSSSFSLPKPRTGFRSVTRPVKRTTLKVKQEQEMAQNREMNSTV